MSEDTETNKVLPYIVVPIEDVPEIVEEAIASRLQRAGLRTVGSAVEINIYNDNADGIRVYLEAIEGGAE